jgi:hypothetical protein
MFIWKIWRGSLMIYLEEIDLQNFKIPFLLRNHFEQVPCMVLEGDNEEIRQFLTFFIRVQERFPVSFVMELFDFMVEDIKEELRKRSIYFRSNFISDKVYFLLEVPEKYLEYVFDLAFYLGKMNQFVGWSLGSKDFFEIEEIEEQRLLGLYRRKTAFPSISLSENETFFWIGYDGKEVWLFSTDEEWNQITNLEKKLRSIMS